jgi:hypothetical protein
MVPGGFRYSIELGGSELTFRELFEGLEDDGAFSGWYTRLLVDSGLDAFYWEHPPLTERGLENRAEFVILEAPELETLRPDAGAFREYFERAGDRSVVSFSNLAKDAWLVAPVPVHARATYLHLARFLRGAPARQVRQLWRATARAVLDRVGEAPLWVSTAGLGVGWLHVRLDSFPKYSRHRQYANAV